ncbi:hypothetical protein ACJX0J_022257, partial [Zea mays]
HILHFSPNAGKIEHKVNLGVATRRGYQIRAQPLRGSQIRAQPLSCAYECAYERPKKGTNWMEARWKWHRSVHMRSVHMSMKRGNGVEHEVNLGHNGNGIEVGENEHKVNIGKCAYEFASGGGKLSTKAQPMPIMFVGGGGKLSTNM